MMEHKSYEDIRLENIRRNEQFLQEIGLTSLSNNISQAGRCATAPLPCSTRNKRKISSNSNAVTSGDTKRRSNRLKNVAADTSVDIDEVDKPTTKRRNSAIPNEIDYSEYEDAIEEDSQRKAISVKVCMTPLLYRYMISQDVRELIEEMNPEHQKLVKDKILSHCVYRINYMSARAAFTRVKKISGVDKLLTTYYCLVCADMIDVAQVAQFALERKGFLIT